VDFPFISGDEDEDGTIAASMAWLDANLKEGTKHLPEERQFMLRLLGKGLVQRRYVKEESPKDGKFHIDVRFGLLNGTGDFLDMNEYDHGKMVYQDIDKDGGAEYTVDLHEIPSNAGYLRIQIKPSAGAVRLIKNDEEES
jgi:hypothetical protein